MALIQWYPGHMNKAKNQIIDNLHLVDVVLEVLDARIPISSRNPLIQKLAANKKHLIILNKADLADPNQTARWIDYFKRHGHEFTIAFDAQHTTNTNPIVDLVKKSMAEKTAALNAKGAKNPTIRVVCVGIPNCGKSTILNRLVGKNVAVVGDRPGVTKNQNWLKAKGNIQVLDTPGILWPKFDDQEIGVKLALTGAIKEGLYHEDDVALFALSYFRNYYPQVLTEKLGVGPKQLALSDPDLLLALTKKFGFKDEYERMAQKIIFDLRKGTLGRITLEQAPVSATEA